MKRLTKKEKGLVIKLMKQGKSLNHISKHTKRGKSTIYYYYKKIFGKKFKNVEVNYESDEFVGELVGIFVGDGGHFYDTKRKAHAIRFYFNNSEKEYVTEILQLLHKNLNKKSHLYRVKNVLIIRYYSKILYDFLMKYVRWEKSGDPRRPNKKSRTVSLRSIDVSREFKIGFLRGFIDTDGHISNKKIVFSSSSNKIIQQSISFLNDLGFKELKLYVYKDRRGNRVDMHHINIRKGERDKFFQVIKPRNLMRLKNAPTGI